MLESETLVVDGRFVLEERVGAGGMGDVYRGRDTLRNELVALKLLKASDGRRLERFAREAAVLAELKHPAIVGYVAHGISSNRPYLAMEWLEGETLESRLTRGPLALDEVLQLGLRVGEGLCVAHARGVAHRDLKPSNILLVGGSLAEAKLIDFGVAKRVLREAEAQLTRTGVLIGTPLYMSPEQARGGASLDLRTDLFSLGATLYECITGRAPFRSDNLLALAAEICLQDPPRPRELVPELPEAFDRLIMRMLEKDPELRPRDARELTRELHALGRVEGGARAQRGSLRPSLATGEQRVVTIVLMAGLDVGDDTLDTHSSEDAHSAALNARLRALASTFGVAIEQLSPGKLAACFASSGPPTDQAIRATRFAVAAAEQSPLLRIAVATGRSVLDGRLPIGAVAERGAKLALVATQAVAIDPLTSELVAQQFHVEPRPFGALVLGERDADDSARSVLGQPTPFVGRKLELTTLEGAFESCVEESRARGALVIAPAGMGKTRLWHELHNRLERRGQRFELLVGKADAVHSSAPFGLLASVLRRSAGIVKGDDLERRRDKLRACVKQRLNEPQTDATLGFLGELAGVPFADAASPALQAARHDPKLMGEQIRSAWLLWLRALLAEQPVLMVLEDLHWADLPSVQLMDAALRSFEQEPLFVLAAARPEVSERFPGLWEGRMVDVVRVLPLAPKLAEQLVRQVLAERAEQALVTRLVRHSEGNTFFLEELMRAVAEGSADALPDTVMGMVQQRLDSLGIDAGRVLRAASVFGEEFSREGVAALTDKSPLELGQYLELFEGRDLVSRASAGHYTFRHGLVRETCYAALTPEDRVLAHRLAGDFLEKSTDVAPAVLAEHFDHGHAAQRAAYWYARGGTQALSGPDYDAALKLARRGLALGGAEPVIAELHLIEAQVLAARCDFPASELSARAAVEHASEGSALWFDAMRELCWAVAEQYKADVYRELAERAERAEPKGAGTAARIACLSWFAGASAALQQADLGERLFARCTRLLETEDSPAWVRSRFHYARACHLALIGQSVEALREVELAHACATASNDVSFTFLTQVGIGTMLIELGAVAQGLARLRSALATSGIDPNEHYVAAAQIALSSGSWQLGRADDTREHARAASLARVTTVLSEAHVWLARAERDAGNLSAACEEAGHALRASEGQPRLRCAAEAVLALVMLDTAQPAAAERHARTALALLDTLGEVQDYQATIRVSAAEVFWALGAREEARAVIQIARERLLERASRLEDAELRAGFLVNLRDHRRTLELAEAWGAVGESVAAPGER